MSVSRDNEARLKARAIRAACNRVGLAEQSATQIVEEIFDGLFTEFGGERLYFCREPKARIDERDANVLAEFNGRNKQTVCRRYGISERTLYRILHRRSRITSP